MHIPQHIYDEMLQHAREEAPNECCGIIGGIDGEVTTIYRARNSEQSPLRYDLHSDDLFRITHREIPEKGEDMLAIYHSHTNSPAYPSQTDRNLATYPDAAYLIVSLAEGEKPLRGFWLRNGRVKEIPLTVGAGPDSRSRMPRLWASVRSWWKALRKR